MAWLGVLAVWIRINTFEKNKFHFRNFLRSILQLLTVSKILKVIFKNVN
jgi:hypothetical protein